MPENYSGRVGVHGFHFAILEDDSQPAATYSSVQSILYTQSIGVTPSQEFVKAYGDNKVADVATSNGTTEVTMGFHEIPIEIRAKLLGYEEDADGLIIRRGNINPPYVGIVFFQDKADGTVELVGLAKGKFMLPATEGSTKQDSVEFASQEISGEFNPRIADDVSEVKFQCPKDDTESINKVFQKIFAQDMPTTDDTSGATDGTTEA